MRRTSQNLGHQGESFFDSLCSAAGLTANKSEKDVFGWDYLVEFATINYSDLPQDIAPLPIQCKVQVKSTTSTNTVIRIKLSSLLRLVQDNLPVFFVLIRFSNSTALNPKSIRILHLGKELIEDVLKKVRSFDVKGEGEKLHKQSIPIKFPADLSCAPISGESFRSIITSYINEGMQQYTKWKTNLRSTLGYEGGSNTIEVSLSGDQNSIYTGILDLTLGLRDELEIDRLEARHTRFGLTHSEPYKSIDGGLLQIDNLKPTCKTILTISEKTSREVVDFPMDLCSSHISSLIPDEHLKYRLTNKYFQFVFQPNKGQMDLTVIMKDDQQYPFVELYEASWMLNAFVKGDVSLRVSVGEEGKTLLAGQLGKVTFGEDPGTLFQLFEKADSISHTLGIKTHRINVSITSILRMETRISALFQVLNSKPESVLISTPFRSDFPLGKDVACIVIPVAIIGDLRIAAFHAITGQLFSTGNDTIELKPNSILRGPIVKSSALKDMDMKELCNINETFHNKLREEEYIIVQVTEIDCETLA